ncbi:helix-turn-helix domain-containing protein [Promicromonospora xylanilytica]
MELDNLQETGDCHRVASALARAGDKWSFLIFMQLEAGSMRFNELRRQISGISPKMLAVTLRGLERDGLVSRTVYPTKPPGVEYALTELGQEMAVPVRALGGWVLDNIERIEAARQRFDAAAGD